MNGFIEYWDTDTFEFPASGRLYNGARLKFTSKFSTDLFKMVERKTFALSLTISPDQEKFCICTKDRRIDIYDVLSAKIIKSIDLSIPKLIEMQNYKPTEEESKSQTFIDLRLHGPDFNKKIV